MNENNLDRKVALPIRIKRIKKKELPYQQMLPSVNNFICDNNLTVSGAGFTRVVTSFVNEDGNGIIISELYVPID